MADKQWTFELSEAAPPGGETAPFAPRRRSHTVTLHHNYWTTTRTILVDGALLPASALRSHNIYGQGSDDLFELDGHTCHVWVRSSNGVTYDYDFAVDGMSVQSGQPVQPRPAALALAPGRRGNVPWWGWMFFVPLLVAVVIGLVAALVIIRSLFPTAPNYTVTAIGAAVVGFQQIISTAADYSLSSAARVRRCVLICLGAGAVEFALMLVVGLIFH